LEQHRLGHRHHADGVGLENLAHRGRVAKAWGMGSIAHNESRIIDGTARFFLLHRPQHF
jgi:hypothetical protein